MTTNRKDPRNFGTITSEAKFPPDAPVESYDVAVGRYSVVMPERVFLALLRDEITRLSAPTGLDDLRRFYAHFFDPMITSAERETYVGDFQRNPPIARLGYPRTSVTFPCFAVVMERESMDQEALGKYLGQTQEGDPTDSPGEYVGSLFESTYGVYVYAEHPDVCLYLYQFAKAVLLGSHRTIAECGILDLVYDGNEMLPQDSYMPENMFVRRLGVTCKSLHTVPALFTNDPSRMRITGIWARDIVVSGIRGGVTAIDPEDA